MRPLANAGSAWTREDNRELRTLLSHGMTYRECAEELGRTHHAVRTYARKVGCSRPPGRNPDIDRRAWVLSMLTAGLSVNRIAQLRKASRASTIHLLRRMVKDGMVVRIAGPRHNATRYVPADRKSAHVNKIG